MAVSRGVVIALLVSGFLLALRPLSSLVAITTVAFTGIGVLYPATIAALYWEKATKWGALSSIVAGESVALLITQGVLPVGFSLGTLPIVPGLIAASVTLVIVSALTSRPTID